jgi:hypothetical protein
VNSYNCINEKSKLNINYNHDVVKLDLISLYLGKALNRFFKQILNIFF